jgi:hypothetical protein
MWMMIHEGDDNPDVRRAEMLSSGALGSSAVPEATLSMARRHSVAEEDLGLIDNKFFIHGMFNCFNSSFYSYMHRNQGAFRREDCSLFCLCRSLFSMAGDSSNRRSCRLRNSIHCLHKTIHPTTFCFWLCC